MFPLRCAAIALLSSLLASAAPAQSINQNFSATASAGSTSQNSTTSVAAGTGFAWQVQVSSLLANGTIFSQPVPLPLTSYGVHPADLTGSGLFSGPLPGALWTKHFTFTDAGATVPTYDFTLSVVLNANFTTTASLIIHNLNAFTAGGVTGSPVPIPVNSISVQGNAQVSPLIPAPGPSALALCGAALLFRRKR